MLPNVTSRNPGASVLCGFLPLLVSTRRALAVVALLALAGCRSDGSAAPGEEPEIVVYAAASLRDALSEIDRDFARVHRVRVVENFAGSNQLSQQILASPKVDLFVSASESWMDRLEQAQRLVPGTRRTLLSNQLVVVASEQSALSLGGPEDLADGTFRFLVLANPAVPAGRYARQYLRDQGVWSRVEKRVLPMPDVRAALAQAERQSDVVAMVYASDAKTSDRVKVLFRVPISEGPKIRYPVSLIARDTEVRPAARELLALWQSDEASRVFARYGFLVGGESAERTSVPEALPEPATSGLGEVLQVSLLVAIVSTLLTMLFGTPLAYLLARREFFGKRIVSALVVLPLGLPPTAVGYLLLQGLSEEGLLGRARLGIDLDLLFTWKGAALASIVMSSPFVVRTARVAFEGVSPRLEGVARTLGHNALQVFVRVTLPLARRGLLAAAMLGFLRSIGEFGATVLVAGSVRGKTQTLASAIFNAEQAGNDHEAWVLIVLALTLSFVFIFAAEALLDSGKGRARG